MEDETSGLSAALEEETSQLQDEFGKLIAEANERREAMFFGLAKIIGIAPATDDDVSAETFFETLQQIGQVNGNLREALRLAGYDGPSGMAWINGEQLPPKNLRPIILHNILQAAVNDYATTRLYSELLTQLGLWANENVDSPSGATWLGVEGQRIPSDTLLAEAPGYDNVPSRTRTSLHSGGFDRIIDLQACTDIDFDDTEGIGPKAKTDVRRFLTSIGTDLHQFEGDNTEREKIRQALMVRRWFRTRGESHIQHAIDRSDPQNEQLLQACRERKVHRFKDLVTASEIMLRGEICDGSDDLYAVLNYWLGRTYPPEGVHLGMEWPEGVSP